MAQEGVGGLGEGLDILGGGLAETRVLPEAAVGGDRGTHLGERGGVHVGCGGDYLG